MDTLVPLNVPVSFLNYNLSDDTYIVFNEYNQMPWLNANDTEMWTKHFIQVDVFSKGNYINLVKEVKNAMKQAGFGRMFESETYDNDMNMYRKILRFSYISKEEN